MSAVTDVPPPLGTEPEDRGARESAARAANRSDRIFVWVLQGIAGFTLVVVAAIAIFVLIAGWPSFAHNGLRWFTAGKDSLDTQLGWAFAGGPDGKPYYEMNAWSAIAGTLLTTFGALLIAFPISVLTAIFMAELAPKRIAAILNPIVTMLAATPSVIFGLFAIIVIGPWLSAHVIPASIVDQLAAIVPISGQCLLLGILVLAVMVSPLMTAIFTDALRAVPVRWKEGAIALGCDPWRMSRRVSLQAIRPALVAGSSLAMGRAVGEAIALSMAGGSFSFTPNPLDGVWMLFEPVRPLAATIVDYSEAFDGSIVRADLFAIGVVLFITTASLTIAGKAASGWAQKRLEGS